MCLPRGGIIAVSPATASRGARAPCTLGPTLGAGASFWGRDRRSRQEITVLSVADFTSMVGLMGWCHGDALADAPLTTLLAGFGAQLRAAGLPVERMNLTVPTLHPQLVAESVTWWLDGRTVSVPRLAGGLTSEDFKRSPIRPLLEREIPRLQADLSSAGPLQFPVLEELRAQGHRAYLAVAIDVGDRTPAILSFATSVSGGFDGVAGPKLDMSCDALRPALQIHALRWIARNVSATYIGAHAGPRVLSGAIRRGSVETLRAVVWFCDLRGFTPLSATLTPDEVVALLNEFLGAVAGAVEAEDGEILKFIGDAALAIFPVRDDGDLPAACASALRASRQVRAAVAEVNTVREARGDVALRFGMGLHVGEVSYGNIGGLRRLDFTVIGHAVNLASRLEGLCGTLGQPLLASAEVAAALPGQLVPLGTHPIKGFVDPQAVWGLPGI